MSLNNLSKDILLKAEVEKDKIHEQLKANKDALENEFDLKLNSFKDLECSKHKSNIDLNSQKILSFYKKESRKIVLFAKSKIIEDLLDEILDELKELKNADKQILFEKLIQKAKILIDFENVICNKSDLRLVKNILPENIKITSVEKQNGLIFESKEGKEILDMTYENLFTEILSENEDKLQKKLFNI